MIRRWVFNASPTILLAKIGFLDYLLKLCPQPVIPQGIPVRGTLGVVMLARRENLIDTLEPWFAQLLEHGFRIDQTILEAALLWERQISD